MEGGLESNVLTILCWSDKEFLTVRNKIVPEMFSLSALQTIARKAIAYVDEYSVPPKEHLFDLLEIELRSTDSPLMDKFLKEAPDNFKRLNPAYVQKTLDRFLELTSIQGAMAKATDALTEDDLPAAKAALLDVSKFRPDSTFSKKFSKIDSRRVTYFDTGTDRGRIPYGVLTMFVGDPGEGKSLIAIDLTACRTKGLSWPVRAKCDDGVEVAILSFEDAPAETLKPRLEAARADVNKVHWLEPIDASQDGARVFSIPEDLSKIERFLDENPEVRAIFIDPPTAALSGKVDSHQDSSLRRALTPLALLAERRKIAIVCILHLNKSTEVKKAMYRTGGSIAWMAASRAAYLIGVDPNSEDGERRIVANLRVLTGKIRDSMAFKITDDGDEQRPYLIWEETIPNITANDLVKEPESKRGPTGEKFEQALASAQRLFADGKEHPASELEAQVKMLGCSYATFKRAAERLGVISRKTSMQGGWAWRLPPSTVNFQPSLNSVPENGLSEESNPLQPSNGARDERLERWWRAQCEDQAPQPGRDYTYQRRSYEKVKAVSRSMNPRGCQPVGEEGDLSSSKAARDCFLH
jgi:putative DNA primase/helicase